jgi:hypothetical protein
LVVVALVGMEAALEVEEGGGAPVQLEIMIPLVGIPAELELCRKDVVEVAEKVLDEQRVRAYLEQHAGSPVLFFGFTFMIWQHVIKPLQALGRTLPASRSVLMHSGGWKKLEHAKVSAEDFNQSAKDLMHVEQVRNFYGMVEQVGSVFFENDRQFFHAPVFADVIVRDPFTLQPLPTGETGLIQVLSVLPQSYPGHSLLTEDLGRIVGEDDTAAGMPGRFFEVIGRAPRSEVRGCSDTYEQA